MSQENNFIPQQESYQTLRPFKLFVKSNFPFIEETFEALDNYGLYCKIVEYLNTVIANEQAVTENTQALYNAFVSLNTYVSNYFDNLDVQEEINNKLDEMATTGELQSLLNNLYNELSVSINNQLNIMDNKIDSITSGSPAGVYATVADLEASSADHSKIYVVTATGKWYFYNTSTSQWTEGGTYLSTGLANYSVTQEKTNFLKPKKNYYDKSKSTMGGYINTGNGTIVESANYFYTDYIPVHPDTQYTISGSANQQNIIGFYDASKNYISGSGHAYNNASSFTTPVNCYYIRESSYKTVIDNIQIESGAAVTAFENYYLIIDNFIASQIYDNIVNPKKTTFLQHTNNYFDKSTITLGKYVNYGNGVLTDNASFFASDYIEVSPNTEMELAINTLNFQIAFFNSSKGYISGIYYGNSTKKFTTPANAKYLRYSDTQSVLNRNQMLQIGTTTTQFIKCGYEFTDEISLQTNYFEVGEGKTYETLKEGIVEATKYNNSIVYVNEGTYDLYEEFGGDDFFESYTSSSTKGLTVKNNVHLIFSPNSKVVFNYEGSNEYVNSLFSPFNSGEGGFIIENLTLEAKNCRYCIHDERGTSTELYTNKYINCNLKLDNTDNPNWSGTQTIGGGLGHNGLIEIQNCIIYGGISYHNNNSSTDTTAKSKIIINNIYSKSGSIRMSHCGVSTRLTECIISNNSLPNAITVSYERPGTDVIANMDVYQFNNVIRT